jgi:uncharacterized protein YuzE
VKRGVLRYDPEAHAAYVKYSDNMVLVTREMSDCVLIDLDADANIVGVELLYVEMEKQS